jgi:hypothetical protein
MAFVKWSSDSDAAVSKPEAEIIANPPVRFMGDSAWTHNNNRVKRGHLRMSAQTLLVSPYKRLNHPNSCYSYFVVSLDNAG